MSFFSLLLLSLITEVLTHGRFIEPPARTSAWRFGFGTPRDYNDHETNCGGFSRQWTKNGGRCGQCGDAWDLAQPRPGEAGGKFGRGVIVRSYRPGQTVKVTVDVTANHRGYFQFRLCPQTSPTVPAPQDCFDNDQNLLELSEAGAGTRFYIRPGTGSQSALVRLPAGVRCEHCILQWTYRAGNNWGLCQDGQGRVGCGPQEEFRACADIKITDGNNNNNNNSESAGTAESSVSNTWWGSSSSSSSNNNNNNNNKRPVKPESSWSPWSWFTELIKRRSGSSWSSSTFQWRNNQNFGYLMSSLLNRPGQGRGKVVLDNTKTPGGILAQYRQFCKDIAEAIITKISSTFTNLFS